MRKERWTNRNGFTLLETILSVATLALLSGFVLQMFIVAAGINAKAKNIDQASAEAMTLLESVKAADARAALSEDAFFDGFTLSSAEPDTYLKVYDSMWQTIDGLDDEALLALTPERAAQAALPQAALPDGCAFLVRVTVTDEERPEAQTAASAAFPADPVEAAPAGVLTAVSVDVYDLAADADKGLLVRYAGGKYFPFAAEGGDEGE